MILFISDLHLQEERPDITRAFLSFLTEKAHAAEALYILGDLFEVWVGDDAMTTFQHEIASALKTLSDQGTRIYLMHGNRDFMLGEAFCRRAGCQLIPDPTHLDLYGTSTLLMHGDVLCLSDTDYLKQRKRLRHPASLWLLKHLPLALRQRLATQLRQASRRAVGRKAADIMDADPEEALRRMAAADVSLLIHGHTHRPRTHQDYILHHPVQRVVLGDWDTHGWYAQADAKSGIALHRLSPSTP